MNPLADHPRIRGEHGQLFGGDYERRGSSPHTRGAPHFSFPFSAWERIIPAYAGSTSARRSSIRVLADHPRIRGEHDSLSTEKFRARGSSPHTRGAHLHAGGRLPRYGIIPAYAGSTTNGRPSANGTRGSSPHTRGAPRRLPTTRPCFWIIPAYAGSTQCSRFRPSGASDHPRIRGEHLGLVGPSASREGSSPHTRGAPSTMRELSACSRIIPAYAGSTRRLSGRRSGPADHPRIRGEHIKISVTADTKRGSSPHTRGALPHHVPDFGQ